MLPLISSTIGIIIIRDGTNAKNVVLNAMAILFILELDNLVFVNGIPDEMRVYFETNARVSIDGDGRRIVMLTKLIYVVGMTVIIMGSALMSDGTWTPMWFLGQAVVEGATNACFVPDGGRGARGVWAERFVCVFRFVGKMLVGFALWAAISIYQA